MSKKLEALRLTAAAIMQSCVDARLASAENQRLSHLNRVSLSEILLIARQTMERSRQLRYDLTAGERAMVDVGPLGNGSFCVRPVGRLNTAYLTLSAGEAVDLVGRLIRSGCSEVSCSTIDGRAVTLTELRLLGDPRPILYRESPPQP